MNESANSSTSCAPRTRRSMLNLITDTHDYLVEGGGRVGPWEHDELAYAEAARRANMLRLAITCVAKALDVSTLPPKEYEVGYNYSRRRVS